MLHNLTIAAVGGTLEVVEPYSDVTEVGHEFIGGKEEVEL
jgi:hypothetical protein